jgi:hypothetical protein
MIQTPANDEQPVIETLEDAVTTDIPQSEIPQEPPQPEPPAKPMTTTQLLGAVGMFSSFGLPPEVAASYRNDLENDQTLSFLLEMLGLADALAAYGIGAGGGKMPDWLKVILGAGVLGWFLYQKRGKYGTIAAAPVVDSDADGGSGFSGSSAFGGFAEAINVTAS